MIITLEGLNYKKSLHKYILDKDYYTSRTAITLEEVLIDEESSNIYAVVESYLVRASTVLYGYIYSLNPGEKKYIEYRLCHEKDLAEMIREALIELVNYWVLNGIDTSILNPVLNINVERSAPVLTKEQVELSQMPLSVKQIIAPAQFEIQWIETYDSSIFKDYENEELLVKE